MYDTSNFLKGSIHGHLVIFLLFLIALALLFMDTLHQSLGKSLNFSSEVHVYNANRLGLLLAY